MAIVFQHDFEDNSLATWTGLGSVAPTIVTSPVYEGSRALRCLTSAQNVQLQKTFTADNTLGCKFAVRRIHAVDEAGILFRVTNTDGTRKIQVQNISDALNLRYDIGAGDVTIDTGPTFTQNQWFLVDLRVNISANPWAFGWKVDGIDQGDFTVADAATTFDRIDIGTFGFDMNWETAMDKIMVSDEFAYIVETAGVRNMDKSRFPKAKLRVAV